MVSSPSAVRSVSVTVGHNSQCAKHRQCASAPDLLLHLAHHDPYGRWYCFAWQLNLQHLQLALPAKKRSKSKSIEEWGCIIQLSSAQFTEHFRPDSLWSSWTNGSWLDLCLFVQRNWETPKKTVIDQKEQWFDHDFVPQIAIWYRSTDLPVYASAAIPPTTKTSSPVLQPGSQDSCPQSIARISAPHHTGVGVASVARMGSRRACHFATWLQLLCVWLFLVPKTEIRQGKMMIWSKMPAISQ